MNDTVIRRTLLSGFLLAAVLTLMAADTIPPAAPPIAKKVPKITEINGRKMVDNYFWLRDKPNPEVRAYLEAENAYTDALMKPTESFQKKLYDELLSRVKETDVEVPYKEGDISITRDPKRANSMESAAGKRAAWMLRRRSCWT